MSVKKAITILGLLIDYKTQAKSGILDLIQKWGFDGQDVMTRNAKMMASLLQNDIEWLQG